METPALAELSLRVNGSSRARHTSAALRHRDKLRAVHGVLIPAVQFPVNAGLVANQPVNVLLGPEDGQVWDVRRVSVAGLAAAAPAGQSSANSGSVTSPGAAATITSLALPAGTYSVQWTVVLSGTLGAGDTNNLQLTNGAAQVAPSLNAGAAGTYVQQTATVVVPAGGATVAVKSIAAATAGGVYAAQLTASPQASAGDAVKLYRELTTPATGNPQNFLHKFTEAAPDWAPGGGLLMHSPEQLLLQGAGIAAASLVLNAEGVGFEAAWEADYLL